MYLDPLSSGPTVQRAFSIVIYIYIYIYIYIERERERGGKELGREDHFNIFFILLQSCKVYINRESKVFKQS